MQDLRLAVRLLRRNPGFAVVAILALALGIGANTAIFSLVDVVLLRQLPYPQPEQIVMVWEDASALGFPQNAPAPANWADWRRQNTVFTSIAATRQIVHHLTGNGAPEAVVGRRVTPDFWAVLGTSPLMGRVFTEGEDRTNAKVVVISYGLWQRRFGGDAHVIGRKVLMTDEPFEVIGVMPERFVFPDRRNQFWLPSELAPQTLARRGSHFLTCVARMKPGVTLAQAQSEMATIARRLEDQYPDTNKGLGTVLVPLRQQIAGNLRIALSVLLGASGCVLLIACANLANLLLAKASGRQQEMAVRTALGAGRGRIVRQVLIESLLLSTAGAIAGLVAARLGMLAMEKLIPVGLDVPELHLDLRVLLFTGALTIVTGIVFGMAPALSAADAGWHDALKQGGRGGVGARRNWLRDALVVGETGIALTLLTGAGLIIETLDKLQRTDLGMRLDHVLTMTTDLARSRYPEDQPAKREVLFNAVTEKVRAIPGVLAAGYALALPLTSTGNTSS